MRRPRDSEYEDLPEHIRAILAKHGVGVPLSAEIRALILAEPATVSNRSISRRYKLKARTISQVRRAAGIITPGMQQKQNLPGIRGWRAASDAEPPA